MNIILLISTEMEFLLHLIVEYNHVHVVERSIIDQFSRVNTRYTCTLIYIRIFRIPIWSENEG